VSIVDKGSEDQKFLACVSFGFEFSFESESLIVSLKRLRILRTVAASEDSNLEVKKKSP
jgi:hypothetical protein